MKIISPTVKHPLVGTQNTANREGWLKSTLLEIPHNCRILDAGAGELKYKNYCQHLDYVSQDFGKYDGAGDSKGLHTGNWDQSKIDILSDITCIPEAEASFDAIMCIEVLEHLPTPLLAIKEFERLLKPGGTLILTAPVCSLTHFAPYYFYSGFSQYFYADCLEKAGFTILQMVPNGNYFEFLAQELRRVKTIEYRYATKKRNLNKINKLLFELAKVYLLKYLNKLSQADKGSSELLCFGYHIKALKKPN